MLRTTVHASPDHGSKIWHRIVELPLAFLDTLALSGRSRLSIQSGVARLMRAEQVVDALGLAAVLIVLPNRGRRDCRKRRWAVNHHAHVNLVPHRHRRQRSRLPPGCC